MTHRLTPTHMLAHTHIHAMDVICTNKLRYISCVVNRHTNEQVTLLSWFQKVKGREQCMRERMSCVHRSTCWKWIPSSTHNPLTAARDITATWSLYLSLHIYITLAVSLVAQKIPTAYFATLRDEMSFCGFHSR